MSFLSVSSITSLPDLALTPGGGAPSTGAMSTGGASFADTLKQAMSSTVDTVARGEAAALGGMQGTVPLQAMVERVMDAERSLQAAMAVRDKIVSAYLDISKMQI